ncbi:adenylate/guanylate cyclase domain-containing protein [Caenispirillum salinarum]|uniref:adenylate/guanylate cyclase domain-containing protein n=1 Tax=Caenispirillum salinarum TaxID=859058 RepID=UPI00385017AE
MPAIVNYELYVLEGAEWSLHARFPGDERSKAIAEAQSVESQTNKPTKVTRETWYPDSNTSDEALAYISPRAKQAMAEAKAARASRQQQTAPFAAAYGRPDFAFAGAPATDAPPPRTAAKDFVLRLSMVMVSALIIAILGTGMASLFMGQLAGMGVALGGNLTGILFLVFISLFLLSAVPLVLAYVPLEGLSADRSKGASDDPEAARRAAEAAEKERNDKRKTAADEKAAAAKEAADKASRKTAEGEDAGHLNREAEARQRAEAEAAAKAAAAAQEALKKATTEGGKDGAKEKKEDAAEKAEEPPAPPRRAEPEPDAETLKFEQDRARMMKFLGAAVRVLRTSHPQLDAFNKFGANLFLSGAAQALSERAKQPRRTELLRETIEVIGTKPKLAESFVSKLDEYMAEPRYVAMAEAGRKAMEQWLAKKPGALDALPRIMNDWNTPATKAPPPSMITIVFTDMVGSTDLTDEIGDAAAQESVRAHNAVVRSALAQMDGREVKHTGDGIMATFSVAANAVAASIEIQRAMQEHNKANPDRVIRLRVGLNAGEPIAEDNDYFGATVQLASRLCNAAETDQIVCSSVVRDLCAGKPFSFNPLGALSLKGVREPVEAYAIPWEDAAPAVQSAAEPPTAEAAEAADEAAAAARALAESRPEAVRVKDDRVAAGPRPVRP